jgi:hypothetical protein
VTTYGPQTTDPKAPAWARHDSHLAGALDVLRAALNAHWPNRDHGSDGAIGDAAHLAVAGASDHNPWLNNTVRGLDVDVDGIDAGWLAEQLRLAGAAGDHRLTGGGYVIFNRQITSADFHRWMPYTGSDPHTSHVHVSVTRDPAGYEDRGAWAFLDTVQQPEHPGRVWAPGKDATGADAGFRAHFGDEGPEVAELQHDLNATFPAYSKLEEDGIYGQQTAAVLDQFSERAAADPQLPASAADRQALRDSDGRDVGPRTARALDHYGVV